MLIAEEFNLGSLLQQRVIQARAKFAGNLSCKDFSEAERLYLQALHQAEHCDGYCSPLAGHVLIGLHDLYEAAGRLTDATKVWERIRQILIAECSNILLSSDSKISEQLRRHLERPRDGRLDQEF